MNLRQVWWRTVASINQAIVTNVPTSPWNAWPVAASLQIPCACAQGRRSVCEQCTAGHLLQPQ